MKIILVIGIIMVGILLVFLACGLGCMAERTEEELDKETGKKG